MLKQKFNGGGHLFSGEQDEEIPTEEGMEEFVDHFVESFEHERKDSSIRR